MADRPYTMARLVGRRCFRAEFMQDDGLNRRNWNKNFVEEAASNIWAASFLESSSFMAQVSFSAVK